MIMSLLAQIVKCETWEPQPHTAAYLKCKFPFRYVHFSLDDGIINDSNWNHRHSYILQSFRFTMTTQSSLFTIMSTTAERSESPSSVVSDSGSSVVFLNPTPPPPSPVHKIQKDGGDAFLPATDAEFKRILCALANLGYSVSPNTSKSRIFRLFRLTQIVLFTSILDHHCSKYKGRLWRYTCFSCPEQSLALYHE
jgi:hypothetical protein